MHSMRTLVHGSLKSGYYTCCLRDGQYFWANVTRKGIHGIVLRFHRTGQNLRRSSSFETEQNYKCYQHAVFINYTIITTYQIVSENSS